MAKDQPKERGIEATLAALAITPPQAPAPAAASTLPLTDDTDADDDPLADGDDDLVDSDDDPSLQGGDVPLPPGDRPPPIAPAFVPPAAPATRGRPPKPPKPPAGVRLDKALTSMAPGADRVKIYFRKDGQRWFIREFTRNDLKGFSDYDSFVTRYLKPTYGPGEYNIVGVDAHGKEYELGEVRLMPDPNDRSPEHGAMGLVERVLNEARDQQAQLLSRMGSQQSPLEILTGVMALKKQLEGEAGEPLAAAARAVEGSKSDMVQMMMLMMQMQQQQAAENQKMLMTLMAPKEDPITKLLLMKMLEGGGLGGGGGGGGALPPPPPPEKKESMAELITALGTFMASMAPGGGDDGYKELLTTLLPQLLAPRSDGLGTKEIIELLITKRPEGGNEFKSAIDNMATMMNIAQNFNRANEPGAAAGFFDMMSALFSNRDFAGSLAHTIRSKLDGSAGAREQQLKAEEQRLLMERRQLERERRTLVGGGQPAQQAPQQGATAPQQPQQQTQRPPHTPMVTTEQAQEAAKRVVERQGTLPPLPNLTYEHVNSIVMAKDEGECVAKIVSMLIYFAEHEGWKQFIEQILSAFRDGERKRALQWLKALFEGLEQIGMLPPKSPPALLGLMDKHFKTIQEQLAELSVEADTKITAEALVEGPNIVEAPAEPPAAPPATPDAAPEAAPPAAE